MERCLPLSLFHFSCLRNMATCYCSDTHLSAWRLCQRAKGSIIIFFALHLVSVLIDWTLWTIYMYFLCFLKQFWRPMFYLLARHVENKTSQLLYVLDAHSEIYEQTVRRSSITHLGNTHSRIHACTYTCPHIPFLMGWSEKATAHCKTNLRNKLRLQKYFILEMFC